jgi:hypothetical protein
MKVCVKLSIKDTSITETSINILGVEKDNHDGILVTFSDGTVAGYVAEELLLLRPIRERVDRYRTHTAPQES